MSLAAMVFIGSVAVAAVLVWGVGFMAPGTGDRWLHVHCAAGLKAPVEVLARAYEREVGVTVQLSYGGSGALLAGLEISRRGDLYLPADDSYLDLARDKGFVTEVTPLASQRAVLAIWRDNPKQLRSLGDVMGPGVILAHANPEAAAIGKLARATLEQAGLWEAFAGRIKVYKPTVNEVANDIKLGVVDAGIVWDTLLPQYPELVALDAEVLRRTRGRVVAGVLEWSGNMDEARRFAAYLGESEVGKGEWARYGYGPP